MVHRTFPTLGALCFMLAATVQTGSPAASPGGAQYSEAGVPVPAPRADGRPAASTPAVRLAQSLTPPDADVSEAAKSLKAELDRIRREASGNGNKPFDPPLPVRKKSQPLPFTTEAGDAVQAVQASTSPGNPQVSRLMGHLLLLSFHGTAPSDSGPKAIHTLFQGGHIAGAMFSRENIQSKAQLKELVKFLWPGSAQSRPIFAIKEVGGEAGNFPVIRDFEQWPAERDVASNGDPGYAYSTYRSLGSALAGLGFNVNFGPVLASPGNVSDQASSFGSNPLQTGVFAKTFILGHREENVIAVPMTDATDHSVHAMKTLLVANPKMPVAMVVANGGAGASPLLVFEKLVIGVKFCFLAPPRGSEGASAAEAFEGGCDALVIEGGDNPSAVREAVVLALSQALETGSLSMDRLEASAQRMGELRPSASEWRLQ